MTTSIRRRSPTTAARSDDHVDRLRQSVVAVESRPVVGRFFFQQLADYVEDVDPRLTKRAMAGGASNAWPPRRSVAAQPQRRGAGSHGPARQTGKAPINQGSPPGSPGPSLRGSPPAPPSRTRSPPAPGRPTTDSAARCAPPRRDEQRDDRGVGGQSAGGHRHPGQRRHRAPGGQRGHARARQADRHQGDQPGAYGSRSHPRHRTDPSTPSRKLVGTVSSPSTTTSPLGASERGRSAARLRSAASGPARTTGRSGSARCRRPRGCADRRARSGVAARRRSTPAAVPAPPPARRCRGRRGPAPPREAGAGCRRCARTTASSCRAGRSGRRARRRRAPRRRGRRR